MEQFVKENGELVIGVLAFLIVALFAIGDIMKVKRRKEFNDAA